MDGDGNGIEIICNQWQSEILFTRNDYRNEFIISYDMQVRCSVSFKSAVDDEQKKNRAINRVIKRSSIFNVQKLNH